MGDQFQEAVHREQGVVLARKVCPDAQPRPIFRPLAQLRTYGIAFDVSRRCQQVLHIHDKRMKSLLPQVSPPSLSKIDHPSVSAMRIRQRIAQSKFVSRNQDQNEHGWASGSMPTPPFRSFDKKPTTNVDTPCNSCKEYPFRLIAKVSETLEVPTDFVILTVPSQLGIQLRKEHRLRHSTVLATPLLEARQGGTVFLACRSALDHRLASATTSPTKLKSQKLEGAGSKCRG
jgi:hypothetical protein